MKINRPIYIKNKSIQKMWNSVQDKFQGRTSYKDFAQSLIDEWNSYGDDVKLDHGSFEKYIGHLLEVEEAEQWKEVKDFEFK